MARILVIDDEPVVRSLLVEILERAGHDVVSAADAAAGLAQLEAYSFDVVVSDVVMPGLSGVELLRELRGRRADVPVLLITGAGMQATFSGADRVLAKPFAHAELTQAVEAALPRISLGAAA
jgi:CheY-like chemotaxis protein